MDRSDGRLPLVIVAGFLGAGKSTWLRHQLYTRRFGRVHLLVNEAAETAVDDLLLGRAERLDVLAGGCACCAGQAALITALRAACDTTQGAIDTLVLENSGLADPAQIARAIAADPVLVRRVAMSQTIVLADARLAAVQLAEEPLARAQIEAAGAIVVTKAEGTPREDLGRLVATLRTLAPDAEISFSEHGLAAEYPINSEALPYPLAAPPEGLQPIRAHRIDASAAGGWWAISPWLSALLHARGDSIVRIKGVIAAPSGRLLLQSVRHHVQPPEILPPAPGPREGEPDFIVLIGRDIDPVRLVQSWERLVVAAG